MLIDNVDDVIICPCPQPIMLLEVGAQPVDVLVMQRVYKYITKVKNVPIINCQNKVGA